MTEEKQILNELVKSVNEKPIDEITVGGLATAAIAGGALAWALKQFKLPPPSKYSKRVSALSYAKSLVQARNDKEVVASAIGLANIVARVLLNMPELRDLGYRIMNVVNDSRLEDYMSDD